MCKHPTTLPCWVGCRDHGDRLRGDHGITEVPQDAKVDAADWQDPGQPDFTILSPTLQRSAFCEVQNRSGNHHFHPQHQLDMCRSLSGSTTACRGQCDCPCSRVRFCRDVRVQLLLKIRNVP
eukprot:s2229_g12.t1